MSRADAFRVAEALTEERSGRRVGLGCRDGELAYWLDDRRSALRYYEVVLATGTRQAELVGEAIDRIGEIRRFETS